MYITFIYAYKHKHFLPAGGLSSDLWWSDETSPQQHQNLIYYLVHGVLSPV